MLPHLDPQAERLAALGRQCHDGSGRLALQPEQDAAAAALEELRLLVRGMGPDARQRAAVSQAAVSRSGPNADFVT